MKGNLKIKLKHFTVRFINTPYAQNTEMLHNFMVWKFCGNAQFWAIHPKLCENLMQ